MLQQKISKHTVKPPFYTTMGLMYIDAAIQKNGKQYVMFLKDETRYPPQKEFTHFYQ